MSASSKKKLRNEQQAAKLTERQLAEQKEAKKLKLYTAAFVIVLAALLIVAVVFGVSNAISNSGTRERNTVAVTVGEHQISNAEFNYFFIDSLNNMLSGNNSYYVQLGLLDTSKPLDEQTNPMTGESWSDYMLAYATENVQSTYALVDAAKAAGYTLSEEDALTAESVITNMDMYASLYGYSDGESYLKAMYGNGADVDSYRTYVENSLLSQAYYNHYNDSLTYEDADLRVKEAENFNKYSSFTYNYYYLNTSKFQEGGTTDENGNTTYSDEEKAAAIKAAEAAAKSLVSDDITSADELDAAIAALSINADSETDVASTLYENNRYSNIASPEVAEWVSVAERKAGDMTWIANETTSVDPETNESVSTISGYYVLYFHSASDNINPLKNARHILTSFEGGSYDSNTGFTTYTDEEKAAAKTAAEDLLAQWKAGEATEESFAALANEHSDDGDGTTGGLYADIYPGQMVSAFEAWCFDENRKAGDTGIVETEYGYHVMYFSGNSDVTYRDYLIEQDLRSEDLNNWYTGLIEGTAVTEGDMSHVRTDIVLNSGY